MIFLFYCNELSVLLIESFVAKISSKNSIKRNTKKKIELLNQNRRKSFNLLILEAKLFVLPVMLHSIIKKPANLKHPYEAKCGCKRKKGVVARYHVSN